MKNNAILLFFIFSFSFFRCSQETVRIGVVVPLKSEQRVMAQGILQGTQLAVEEWNTRGGALGKKVVLEIMDDEANTDKAVELAKELVNKRVVGVIGHMNSNCSIAASQIYEVAGVTMITPSSTNPALTEQNLKNTFRICGRDDIQARIAADFICDILKPRSIYLVSDYSVYGRGIISALKESIGSRIFIKGEASINQGDTIFSDVVNAIKKWNPGIVYFGGYDPEGARLVTQLRQAGIRAVFMGGDGLASENFLRSAGAYAESTYFTFGPPVEDLGSAQHFVRIYKNTYQRIDYYAPYAYDATNILLDAYCRARDRSITDILHNEQFDGVLGLIEFDDKGDVKKAPYMVWTVRSTKFIPWTQGL